MDRIDPGSGRTSSMFEDSLPDPGPIRLPSAPSSMARSFEEAGRSWAIPETRKTFGWKLIQKYKSFVGAGITRFGYRWGFVGPGGPGASLYKLVVMN
jgi:hypothetical protein